MSGIAGMFCRDGAPAELAVVRRMADAIGFRGPDRCGEWLNGSVAFAHRLLITTPEAAQEQQPLTDSSAGLTIVFDGRIDNRSELQEEFARVRLPLRDETDPELVMRAYQHWGEDSLKHILGDFSFVIWDDKKRILFCARDIIGASPFHYFVSNTHFLFGSELIALVRSNLIALRPDESFVAEVLEGDLHSHTDTLLAGIKRLPGAHALVVTADSIRVFRYWSPDWARTLRYRNSAQYGEHLFGVLEQAVACRMRATGSIACYLSGGLDSSSILAVAHHLRSQSLISADVFACSMLFPGKQCDESIYIDEAVKATKAESVRVIWRDNDHPPDWLAEIRRTAELPSHPTIWTALSEHAAACGARVVFWGVGGDEWFTGSRLCYADMLCELHWHTFLNQFVREFFRAHHGWSKLVRDVAGPLVPETLKRVRRAMRAKDKTDSTPAWISRDLARRAHLSEKLSSNEQVPYRSRGQQEMAQDGFHPYPAWAREMAQLSDALHGLESRLPLHDRRVIEFALAIPEEEHWKGGIRKGVLREATRDLLPQGLRRRVDKVEFSSNLQKRISDLRGLLQDSLIAKAGWTNGEVVRQMLDDILSGEKGPTYYRHIQALWSALALECWYRCLFAKGS